MTGLSECSAHSRAVDVVAVVASRWIGKFDADLVLDYIPLKQVKQVATKAKERMTLKMRVQQNLRQSLSGVQQSLDAGSTHADEKHQDSESEGVHDDLEDDDPKRCFSIKTIDEGANLGMSTVLLASSAEKCTKWVEAIDHAAMDERQRLNFEEMKTLTPVRRARVCHTQCSAPCPVMLHAPKETLVIVEGTESGSSEC